MNLKTFAIILKLIGEILLVVPVVLSFMKKIPEGQSISVFVLFVLSGLVFMVLGDVLKKKAVGK